MNPTRVLSGISSGAPRWAAPPIRLAGSVLNEHRHVCAFFNSREDEYRVTLPFITEGLARGERACHVTGAGRRDDHLRRLNAANIDTAALQRTGQLELYDAHDAYLGDAGQFDPDVCLARLEENAASGGPLTRYIAHMDWALEDRPGVERLAEYEMRANALWPKYRDAVICCYDLAKFGGDLVIDILRTHPVVIIGGLLHENPFFAATDELLEELRTRRGVAV